jgi:hypothetical protein
MYRIHTNPNGVIISANSYDLVGLRASCSTIEASIQRGNSIIKKLRGRGAVNERQFHLFQFHRFAQHLLKPYDNQAVADLCFRISVNADTNCKQVKVEHMNAKNGKRRWSVCTSWVGRRNSLEWDG